VEGLDLSLAIPVAVVLARVIVPLFIPVYPLPAILAALVIDGLDQTIFSATLQRDLPGYQSYDKALDIYYLTVTYLATMRNWDRGPAFGVGRFLWYYRLVGVTLFEYTGLRWLLFVFANTFEYFVIAIEGWKVWRNPFRLSARTIIVVAAAIWIFIKLPQEWWIHIAQLDFTDFAKETVFGVPTTASWGEALTNRPLVTIGLLVGLVLILLLLRYLIRRLDPPDWPPTVSADEQADHLGWPRPDPVVVPSAFFGWAFVEKGVLVSLVTLIFASMLPGEREVLAIVIGVAAIIAVSTLVSQWLARRGVTWSSVAIEFVAMSAVNLGIGVVLGIVFGAGPPDSLAIFVLLVALLSLIVVLYDRFAAVGERRFPLSSPSPGDRVLGG
jgi:hypothetical protein